MTTLQAPDLVYICDWLPPDFGAVGQYSLMFANELAEQGQHVALVGLSSSGAMHETKSVGRGRLTIHKLDAQPYRRTRRGERLLWTLRTNTRLLRAAWPMMAAARTVLFTGSPPMFLHWIAPANVVLRRKLVYRITDFHPECAIAELDHLPVWLRLAYWATLFWRRRVHEFEVLGHDQAQLLRDIGIADDRIRFKPDPSPVAITPDTQPLPRPPGFEGKHLLLYSGNWGIAHNVQTFLDGYAAHHRQGSGRMVLWLNAVGSGAQTVEETLQRYGLPFHRTQLVPIDQLGALLVTPDAHLITLSDAFVGFVVPSKVHGCIASRKPVVFIGSEKSDVHRLCWESGCDYTRVAAGDAAGFARTLEHLADLCEDAPSAAQLRPAGAGPSSSREQAMKRALVCGAGGFIGSHLVKRLKREGFWVRGVDLKYPEFGETEADDFILGDLRDPLVARAAVDVRFEEIYQLAADMGGAGYVFTGENDAAVMHNSALINLNILDACQRRNSKRIFYSSSACIYPEHQQRDPGSVSLPEDCAYPAAPDSEYGWEKLFSERLYMAFQRNHGFTVRIARYHNIFGPEGAWDNGREKSPAALARKVAMAPDGGSIEIWGDGLQTRSFLYIDECLEGTVRLARSSWSGPVNIGSDEMVTINGLAQMLMQIAGRTLTLRHVPGPLGVRGRNSDNTLIEQKLGWRPTEPLMAGLRRLYPWIAGRVQASRQKAGVA